MSNEEIIWSFLNNKLNNPYGTAGLMGNLFAESSLNPILANNIKKHGMTNEQYTKMADENKTYSSFVTDGIAYGLAQWCYHTRKKGLLDKAIEQGKSVGDINLQLDYLWEELQKYKTVIETLYSAKSVREASDIVLTKYERPSNQSEGVKSMRARYGQEYYKKYYNDVSSVAISIAKKQAKVILNVLEKTKN